MDELPELLGESPAIEELRAKVRRLLDRQRAGQRLPPILLQGDTGTGKGLVARLLHRHGARRDGPFVDVNCAAIPGTLLEAELFGFERGAFTDARHAKPGLFQAAHGGVLFLDEVALLPDPLQAKLLTALEERAVRRLGSTRLEPADAWFISATNTNLHAAVAARHFREDLYHRLAVLTLDLPPLRERAGDIPLLAERFLARACTEYGLVPKRLDPGAQARLLAHSWPGNVRELANVMERAALLTDTVVVTADSLGFRPGQDGRLTPPESEAGGGASRDDAMRRRLLSALDQAGWNISHTAALLGITRGTVYAHLDKYGLRAARSAANSITVSQAAAADAGLHWEQRSLTFLRVELRTPDDEGASSQSARTLDTIIAKVQSFGGRVEEVSPTGIVAAFGLEPAEDAPRHAAHTAVAVRKEAERARASDGGIPGVRIGLHVASVLIGRVGSRIEIDAKAKRTEWPVLDRLVHGSAPGQTVASAAAVPFLERRFELTPAEAPDGRERIYRLTGEERRGLGLWGAMTRFVGRQEELAILRSRLDAAAPGHGQIVAVVGEAGVGKSRLIYELARAHRLDEWRVLEAAALSYGRAMSYRPVIDLLKGYFAIHDQDEPRAIRERVTGKVLTLDRALEPALPALLSLLDQQVDDAGWRALDPPQRRRRTLDAVRHLLVREAREQPLLLIFEDLHWVDGETQALLDTLVETLGSARILLLMSYRPEYQHPWANKPSYAQLWLDALPAEQAAEFLSALVGDDAGLAPLKQRLVRRGNPFFLEETVRTLVESQALVGRQGDYRLTRPLASLEIPPSVQAILAARIARLSREDGQLLRTAAVVGKNVPLALLAAIAQLDEPALRARLTRLQVAEFVYDAPLSHEPEFTFKHALTHEIAYAGLLPEDRRATHAKVVDAIETLYRDRLGDQTERLAHHALRAGLGEKAVLYLWRAGLRASARFALRDARDWLAQALDTLQALPESPSTLEQGFDIRVDLRFVLNSIAELRMGLERMHEAAALAQRLKDERRQGRAYAIMTNSHAILGELDEAVVAGSRALEIAERLADVPLRVMAAAYLEQTHYYRGEYDRVVELAAANIAALPADFGLATFGASMPLAFYHPFRMFQSLAELGRFSEAGRYEAEARRMVANYPYAVALIHFDAGWLYCLQGDWVTARPLIELATTTYRTSNIVGELTLATAAAAWALARLGETSEALAHLRETESRLERDGTRDLSSFTSRAYRALGHAALSLGRLDEAQSLGNLALRCARSHHGYEAHNRHLLGEIWAHPDCFDAACAESHYSAALVLAEPRGMRPLVAQCHLGLGKLYGRTRRRTDALEHLTTATRMFHDMDMQFWLEQGQTEMARMS